MTETAPEPAGRAWIQYDPAEPVGEIALPGYLNAVPSILNDGDVFSVPAAFVEELTQGGESARFVEVDEPDRTSPNEALTREEIAEKVGDPELATASKADAVAAADEYDRTHPEPPGADDQGAGEGYVPPFDAAVAEANADATDSDDETEESDQ